MERVTVDFTHSKGIVDPKIYGHFSEHIGGVFYDGLWVGPDSKVENINGFRKSLVESFKKIAPPVLRWPGGCFAETYDWRDGIGPREKRPSRVNWWYSRDHRLESNQVGTHEFIEFCRLVGAEPYIAANMTTTTPLHIRDWIEYCNMPAHTTTLTEERAANGSAEPFDVQYWGIGNENWGGGGLMTPEHCADEFMRYTTIFQSLGVENTKFIICGANGHDISWTRRLMQEYTNRNWHEVHAWGMSVHYYTSLPVRDTPQTFTEETWNQTMERASYIASVLDDHRGAMDEFDPERKITLVLDEWGNWHKDGSGPSNGYNLFEQQSNMRDAVVAALTLNIFNDRCDILTMANVAQLCNNLHCLFLAGGDRFIETPTYHVFDMYKGHMGGKQLNTVVSAPSREFKGREFGVVSASSSVKDGKVTVTLANLDVTAEKKIVLSGLGGTLTGKAVLRTLSHAEPHTCNTFDDPFAVTPVEKEISFTDGDTVTLPAAGVVSLTVTLDEE